MLIFAHSHKIAYESLDIMLGRTPRLDLGSLQLKMISGGRGGYCLEQNMLFREGLRSLGYKMTSLQGRVVRGIAIDAPRPAIHMLLQVDLPEGLNMSDDEIRTCISVMKRKGEKGAPHPFFA
jgi:N-hydroxyarylamine O-acetyltransferase